VKQLGANQIFSRRVTFMWLFLLLSISLLAEPGFSAGSETAKETSATELRATATSQKTAGKTSRRGKTVARRKSRKRVVRGQRTIEPTRVVEIQNALAAAGYYKIQPSGAWDEPTSKAMSFYQQENGFKITGKPDALSLKKLGL
jgi:peptidoglycan hydrolase-like protein with peptidoglycan-binding domain